MKLPTTLLVLALAGCGQADPAPVVAATVSPKAHLLAVCSIAAGQSSGWRIGERNGRQEVNRRAAIRLVAKENPGLIDMGAEAAIAQVLNERSNHPQDPEGFYARRCL